MSTPPQRYENLSGWPSTLRPLLRQRPQNEFLPVLYIKAKETEGHENIANIFDNYLFIVFG